VDAALIGGLVISLGDKFCDMSMATKLKKYSDLLKQAA
jgi:F-type H+-transporting ATPase subunit O